ncbi:MAG: hypothetical protein HKN46_01385 [Acidimicrobiia bacterium]|nr:hypothetical protein [Acidimicrobiia bacterium]
MTDEPAPDAPDEEWEPPPVPFSFKLTMVLLAIYLGWRAVQLVLCVPSLFAGVDCQWL